MICPLGKTVKICGRYYRAEAKWDGKVVWKQRLNPKNWGGTVSRVEYYQQFEYVSDELIKLGLKLNLKNIFEIVIMNGAEFKSSYQKFDNDREKEEFLQNYADEDMSEELANFLLDIGLDSKESDIARHEAFSILRVYIGEFDYGYIFEKIIDFFWESRWRYLSSDWGAKYLKKSANNC